MMESLSLAETLDRLLRIPTELPERLRVATRHLSPEKKQDLARTLLRRGNSPLWRTQFEVMLGDCFSEDDLFVSVWNLPPAAAEVELGAYLTLIRWTFDELLTKQATSQWSFPTILASAWAHGDHLFCMLRSCGWDAGTIAENFSLTPMRIHKLFGDTSALDHDVANPHNVTPPVLLACGSRFARRRTSVSPLESHVKSRLRSLLLLSADGLFVPRLDLIPDVSATPNCLGSFLGCDRLALLELVAEGDEREKFPTVRTATQKDARILLEAGEKDGWIVLKAAFGNQPISQEHIDAVRSSICRDSFAELGTDEDCRFLVYASTFLRFVANADTLAQFRQHLLRLSGKLRQRIDLEIDSPGILLEAALNFSRCVTTPGGRVTEFANLVAELTSLWPRLGEVIRPTIEGMCGDLPLSQTAEMWRLNLRLRTR